MFLTVSRSANAYIDGGSGSYLLQIAFAALLGMSVTVKATYANLKNRLMMRRASAGSVTTNESESA